jgi:hypothetical protein
MKPFSVISGAQVQEALRGREKQVAELVEALVNTKRSAKQFARGHWGGILTTVMPASASTASNDAAN